MEKPWGVPDVRFNTPEEEVAFLRKKLETLEASGETKSALRSYTHTPAQEILAEHLTISTPHAEGLALSLQPESHDKQIETLLTLVRDRGIKNALTVVSKLDNPHLEDDFHRALIEYLKEGKPVHGKEGRGSMLEALHMTLYEVSMPPPQDESAQPHALSKLISSMEQLFAGLNAISGEKPAFDRDFFSLELAVKHVGEEAAFYVAVPNARRELFEKQARSLFPEARIVPHPNDYNIFNPDGATAASRGIFTRHKIYPLRTYDTFDHDPLSVILSAFSNLKKEGEGAALQLMVSPLGDWYSKLFKGALDEARRGKPLSHALDLSESWTDDLRKTATEFLFSGKTPPREGPKPEDTEALEAIERKIQSPVVPVNIRLIASAETRERAEAILADLEAAFLQFEDVHGNRLEFRKLKPGPKERLFLNAFSFRTFDKTDSLTLNLKELSTLYHFPKEGSATSRELKEASATDVPAPLELPESGLLLGVSTYHGSESRIYLAPEDRLRHIYVVGQTGTGKTTFLKNLMEQDIQSGAGMCFIDPHGSDIEDLLTRIPQERYDDLIYFDPSYVERPLGLNMLEYDERYPEQKTFVVNEMLAIFNKLFDMKLAGGPAFEQYFRNSALLVMEHPESGNTLFDIGRVLADKSFRDQKLSHAQNPLLKQFWDNAEKTTGEHSLQNFVPYITNKFDAFTSNDILRPIIAQAHSSFNFREVMDGKKILLVNLSKGRLGELNAGLLGLVLVGKLLMAALSRVDSTETPTPFYLYIDEFHNVTTDSIATIFSEARKYKLSLTVAHQYLKQLDEKISSAVFGNVGSLIAFRVGSEDGEVLEKHFAPTFKAHDLMNLDNYRAVVRLLSHGRPVRPFSMKSLPAMVGGANTEALKQYSHARFGRPRAEIEAEIYNRYRKS
jgi:hypothetical protein